MIALLDVPVWLPDREGAAVGVVVPERGVVAWVVAVWRGLFHA